MGMNFPMGINFKISDEVLGIFVPIFIYWIYAGIVAVIETAFPKYKMQTTEEQDEKNLVSGSTVIKGVLVQQSLQAIIAALLFLLTGGANPHHVHAATHAAAGGGTGAAASACRYIIQFVTAMVVMDTWQYFMHRYMHQNKFLYKHIHSHHHRLVAPYAFGALYNHPLEGLMVDTMSGAISFLVSGMSTRASIFFFSFATIKAVDDHSGLWIPWNPFHVFFRNNSGYHALHHQLHGTKSADFGSKLRTAQNELENVPYMLGKLQMSIFWSNSRIVHIIFLEEVMAVLTLKGPQEAEQFVTARKAINPMNLAANTDTAKNKPTDTYSHI